MKKIILFLMTMFVVFGLSAKADHLYVSGHVKDTATGHGIPNYTVHISIDSASNGFSYQAEVLTNGDGFYADTIFFNTGGAPSGIVRIYVYDCRQNIQSGEFAFSPGHLAFEKNFEICTGTPPPCEANFEHSLSPPLTVHFYNTSTGSNGPWLWLFGDGHMSSDKNPSHTYASPGEYYVTLGIGDTICYDSITKEIHVGDSTGGGCHANFSWVYDTTGAAKTVQFTDLSTPAVSTWSWNFGDSASGTNNTSTLQNPVHIYSRDGEFHVCLTITTTNPQCTSTECKEIHVGNTPPPEGCENQFTYLVDWLTVGLEGHVEGNKPATYAWNFGDGTTGLGQLITHTYASPGLYNITLLTILSDSTHCTFERTKHVQVGDSNNISQVYGQVFAGNFPLNHGLVLIFGSDTMPGGQPFFSAFVIDSMGVYIFPYVPQGNYWIWAVPFDSLGGYLPTFYGDVIYWEQATVIHLGNPQNPYNIHLVHAGNMPSGQGGINGHVNTQGLKSSGVEQITMLLSNEQGQPIGFRHVDASGTFDFSGMALGTYYLKAELPNTTSDLVKVVLSKTNPLANVTMTFTGKTILGITEAVLVESFTAYPNPVKDVVNLNLQLAGTVTVTAEIYSFTGQVVSRQVFSLLKGENTVKIDLSLLNAGLYTLRMTSPEGIRIVQKIVKE